MSKARNLADLARTTTTVTELNKLDGFTGDVADLNYAKDLKATGVTTTEFDHLDGVASSLAVTDITSSFTLSSNWVNHLNHNRVFKFNDFVFYNLSAYKSSAPSSGEIVWTTASDYRPHQDYQTNTITYQGDYAHYIELKTNGQIIIDNPDTPTGSDSGFRIIINGWYKI